MKAQINLSSTRAISRRMWIGWALKAVGVFGLATGGQGIAGPAPASKTTRLVYALRPVPGHRYSAGYLRFLTQSTFSSFEAAAHAPWKQRKLPVRVVRLA